MSDVEDGDDVGVVEAGGGLGLVQKALEAGASRAHGAGVEHLEGDGAVEVDVDGLVDDAHAAGAEFADDAVAGESSAGLEAAAAGSDAARADQALDEGEAFEGFAEVFLEVGGEAGDELVEVGGLGLLEEGEVVSTASPRSSSGLAASRSAGCCDMGPLPFCERVKRATWR